VALRSEVEKRDSPSTGEKTQKRGETICRGTIHLREGTLNISLHVKKKGTHVGEKFFAVAGFPRGLLIR